MNEIEVKVIACAADAYDVDAATITLDTNIREEISNQSMKMIAFISNIEDELDVKVQLRDAGNLITIRDFVNRINELRG